MSIAQMLSIVRALLNAAGALIVSQGVMTGETWQMVSGLAMAIFAVVWGVYTHRPVNINVTEGPLANDSPVSDGKGGSVPAGNSRVDPKTGKFLPK